jgi:hypothetical protein
MVIILGGTITLAFAAAIGHRAMFDINQLVAEEGLSLTVYTVLGTIYGILLAFVISGIWENHKVSMASVRAESDALLSIGYIVGAIPTEQTKEIRSKALNYVKEVVYTAEAIELRRLVYLMLKEAREHLKHLAEVIG